MTRAMAPEAASDESHATTAGDTEPVAGVGKAEGPESAPAAQPEAGDTAEAVAAEPPAKAEDPVGEVAGELHDEAPETAEAPPTDGEEAEVPAPEVMARHLLAAWTRRRTGHALLEEWMAGPSFRKRVISRVVKRLR